MIEKLEHPISIGLISFVVIYLVLLLIFYIFEEHEDNDNHDNNDMESEMESEMEGETNNKSDSKLFGMYTQLKIIGISAVLAFIIGGGKHYLSKNNKTNSNITTTNINGTLTTPTRELPNIFFRMD